MGSVAVVQVQSEVLRPEIMTIVGLRVPDKRVRVRSGNPGNNSGLLRETTTRNGTGRDGTPTGNILTRLQTLYHTPDSAHCLFPGNWRFSSTPPLSLPLNFHKGGPFSTRRKTPPNSVALIYLPLDSFLHLISQNFEMDNGDKNKRW